jgi:hypothetical protein
MKVGRLLVSTSFADDPEALGRLLSFFANPVPGPSDRVSTIEYRVEHEWFRDLHDGERIPYYTAQFISERGQPRLVSLVEEPCECSCHVRRIENDVNAPHSTTSATTEEGS